VAGGIVGVAGLSFGGGGTSGGLAALSMRLPPVQII
jgi:hypothetical protein